MIRKLKIKFILIMMSIIGFLFIGGATGISIYLANGATNEIYLSLESQLNEYRNTDGEGDGNSNAPSPPAGDGSGQTTPPEGDRTEIGMGEPRFLRKIEACVVEYKTDTEEITVLSTDYTINETTLKSAVAKVLATRKNSGELSDHNLIYSSLNSPNGIRVAFADADYINSETTNIVVTAAVITAGGLVAVFLLSLFLSNIAVKPVAKAMEEQKRFIADASHELKTPLAVIAANNKILLSDKSGVPDKEKEWLISTEDEIKHMTSIISDMLTLAQNEAMGKPQKTELDLSKLANQICLQFDAVAYEKDISLDFVIDDGISMLGNEKMVRQLFMIFIDNAVKYEPTHGRVTVSLSKSKIVSSQSISSHNS